MHVGAHPSELATPIVGGIGFTMSLFVGNLAYDGPELRNAAKMGILAATALSSCIGSLLLWRAVGPSAAEPEAVSRH